MLLQTLPFLVFFGVTILLEWIIFRGLKANEFIFSSDQLFWFSYQEAFQNFFFVRKMDHFGVFNSWQLVVQFWDTLLYLWLYQLPLTLQVVEKISFFITFFFSFCVSFIGFRKLTSLFFEQQKVWTIITVTLWYCLNPYTLIMWHGGVYNFGLALTYAVAPLLLYFFHQAVFTQSDFKTKFWCAVLLFLSSFVFWLFAVIIFVLFWYVTFYLLFHRDRWLLFLKQSGVVAGLYVLLALVPLFLIFHEFAFNTGDLNTEFLPTFQNQLGGLWYQFLMLFSWGIYTVWKPRTMFPFGEYFLSIQYILATVALYGLIILGIVSLVKSKWQRLQRWFVDDDAVPSKKELLRFISVFVGILALSIFFAKASQKPFGSIFVYLYEHVPFFSVFRSADHRFGFGVVFAVAVLLLMVSQKLKQVLFVGALLGLMFVQSYPLFTGAAHRGQEVRGEYFDRIIHIPDEYQELAQFMNARVDGTSYVLVDPAVQYGRYGIDIRTKEEYVGQDLLPKLVHSPIVYASTSTGMARDSEELLETALKKKQYSDLRRFPIRYIIVRSNTPCEDCSDISASKIQKVFTKIFQNKYFIVYEIPRALPLVSASRSTFRMVNPSRFEVWLRGVKTGDTVNLALSYHPLWRVYIGTGGVNDSCRVTSQDGAGCLREDKVVVGDEWRFLFSPGVFNEQHTKFQQYGNSWTIDTQYVEDHFPQSMYRQNNDGTLDIQLTLFYQPQAWFLVLLGGSFLVFLVAIGYFLFSRWKSWFTEQTK